MHSLCNYSWHVLPFRWRNLCLVVSDKPAELQLRFVEKLTFVVSLQLREWVDGYFAEWAVQQFLGFVLLRLSIARSSHCSCSRSWCSSWLQVRRPTTRRGAACRLGKRSGRAWHEGTGRRARGVRGRGSRQRCRPLRYHSPAQLWHRLRLFCKTVQQRYTIPLQTLFDLFFFAVVTIKTVDWNASVSSLYHRNEARLSGGFIAK